MRKLYKGIVDDGLSNQGDDRDDRKIRRERCITDHMVAHHIIPLLYHLRIVSMFG